jgi:hypothetical protein
VSSAFELFTLRKFIPNLSADGCSPLGKPDVLRRGGAFSAKDGGRAGLGARLGGVLPVKGLLGREGRLLRAENPI